MAYTVTSMQRPPDVGYKAITRHTAEGARELATALAAAGEIEIEIRDDRGNLTNMRALDELAGRSGMHERDVLRRLAPSELH